MEKVIYIFHSNENSFDMIVSIRIIQLKVRKPSLHVYEDVLPQIILKDKKYTQK